MVMYPQAARPRQEVPVRIVGSNTFGRNKKMNPEQTFNMMVSDSWLVQTPGYKKVINIPAGSRGRNIHTSVRGNFMLVITESAVFRVSGPKDNLHFQKIFDLQTYFGTVSVAENIAFQIAICDRRALWIYDWRANIVQKAVLPINTQSGLEITPGFVDYHDGYFIVPDLTSSQWYLSPINDGLGDWNWGAGGVPVLASIQTKPDNAEAVVRVPGKGNLIYAMGTTVVEPWNNVGAQLFPYQRNNSFSIDYGCISSSTIAAMDEYVAFLGVNEKSGPAILVSQGGRFEKLSTDGIDFRLAQLAFPDRSVAFFFRIDGHVFYMITFYDPEDNFSLAYDFNTRAFFYLTDENMDYFVAADIAYYNDTYYFVSLRDGDVYEFNSMFKTYDYTIPTVGSRKNEFSIPHMRVCSPVRLQDNSMFLANSFTFTLEQGVDEEYEQSKFRYISGENGVVLRQETAPGFIGTFASNENVIDPYKPRVDMTISNDGGETFGNAVSLHMNPLGERKNRVLFNQLGASNELVIQLRFWSKSRITVSDGMLQLRTRGELE